MNKQFLPDARNKQLLRAIKNEQERCVIERMWVCPSCQYKVRIMTWWEHNAIAVECLACLNEDMFNETDGGRG
jgi:hypothetical protein